MAARRAATDGTGDARRSGAVKQMLQASAAGEPPSVDPEVPAVWRARLRLDRWTGRRRACVGAIVAVSFVMAYAMLAELPAAGIAARIILGTWLGTLLAWFVCASGAARERIRLDRMERAAGLPPGRRLEVAREPDR